MSIETNLPGRLRNTKLPINHGLMPLYEAVVNSIHAIEEKKVPTTEGRITVEVIRNANLFNDEHLEDIEGFKITDNGVGFNDENINSFKTLDSEYKSKKGCKGVGRLLWLKAFRNVRIESVFLGIEGTPHKRSFDFNASSGVSNERDFSVGLDEKHETIIKLTGFQESYRNASEKKSETIARNLLNHCLWYFIREGGAPKITLKDGEDIFDLDQVFEGMMYKSSKPERIKLKEKEFDLTHLKIYSVSHQAHTLSLCADNRVVMEEDITGNVSGLYGKLKDETDSREYVYSCYVTSDYLDEYVRSERTGFEIKDEVPGGIFAQEYISLNEIRKMVNERASEFLKDSLIVNRRMSEERVEKYVSEVAPRYRPVLGRISIKELNIDPKIKDKDLEITLHSHLFKIEQEVLTEGHNIMGPLESETKEEYQIRLSNYLTKLKDINMSNLAGYVSHRKVILDLLEKALEVKKDGKYSKEEIIHELIFPMKKESNDLLPDNSNLWLIDERLAFHNYLASDRSISSMPITESRDLQEPDLCILNIYDNPILVSESTKVPLASITVIEIKRPMRDDAQAGEEKKDPIVQALGYLSRIRAGEVTTAKGRPIPNSSEIPGFCYILCDLTDTIIDCCEMHSLTMTNDKLGYFGFKTSEKYKAYIEVISFDKLINGAKERNRAFFDKLGFPSKSPLAD